MGQLVNQNNKQYRKLMRAETAGFGGGMLTRCQLFPSSKLAREVCAQVGTLYGGGFESTRRPNVASGMAY